MCIKDKQVIVGIAFLLLLVSYLAVLCRLYCKFLLRNSPLFCEEDELIEEDVIV